MPPSHPASNAGPPPTSPGPESRGDRAERYYREAIAWNAGRMAGWRVHAWVAGLFAFGLLLSLLLAGSAVFGAMVAGNSGPARGLFTGVSLVGAVIGAFHLGRGIAWMGAREAVLRRLETSTCPRCGYDLEGIPAARGDVICPECGADVPVLPPAAPIPMCWRCGYPFIDLAVGEPCPNCGRARDR